MTPHQGCGVGQALEVLCPGSVFGSALTSDIFDRTATSSLLSWHILQSRCLACRQLSKSMITSSARSRRRSSAVRVRRAGFMSCTGSAGRVCRRSKVVMESTLQSCCLPWQTLMKRKQSGSRRRGASWTIRRRRREWWDTAPLRHDDFRLLAV